MEALELEKAFMDNKKLIDRKTGIQFYMDEFLISYHPDTGKPYSAVLLRSVEHSKRIVRPVKQILTKYKIKDV